MRRPFLPAAAFTGLALLSACSDSVRVTNLADGPVVCEIGSQSPPSTDERSSGWRPYTSVVTCDLAEGGTLQFTMPGGASLDRYAVRIWQRTGDPAQPANESIAQLNEADTRVFVIRRAAGKLIIGPDLGQKR